MTLTKPVSSTLDSGQASFNGKALSPLPTNNDGKAPKLSIARKKLLGMKRRILLEHADIPTIDFNESMNSSWNSSWNNSSSTAFEDINDFDREHEQCMQQLKLDKNRG
jgi:hypothetical protein